MSQNKYKEVAIKYRVNDFPSSIILGSRLEKILENLEFSEKPITDYSLLFLQKKELLALFHYAKKEISYSEFLKQAEIELAKRQYTTEIKVAKEKAEQEEKRKILVAKSEARMLKIAAEMREYEIRSSAQMWKYRNDPRTIARRKQAELKEEYGLYDFIEQEDYKKVMNIIHKLDDHLRLSEKDIIWLTTEGRDYFTPELKKCYHMLEAEHHEKEFLKNKNAWSAVNASSHYRKCDLSKKSLSLLNKISFSKIRNKHLKSAICTTRGGSMRDLGEFKKALELGAKAHSYDSKSYHPCTLLGAVNYEIGNLSEGNIWFQKAEQRGASTVSVDHELRSIYKRANKEKKETLRQHLLKLDPNRYSWVKK